MAHQTDIPYIDGQNITAYLSDLSEELHGKYGDLPDVDIMVAGGSALALKYHFRATVDIDADIRFKMKISDCIKAVAVKNQIPSDWLNTDFTASPSYSRRLHEDALFFKKVGCINVYVVSDLSQLCMKMVSGRTKDMPDIKFLCLALKENGYALKDVEARFQYLYGPDAAPQNKAYRVVKRILKP